MPSKISREKVFERRNTQMTAELTSPIVLLFQGKHDTRNYSVIGKRNPLLIAPCGVLTAVKARTANTTDNERMPFWIDG